MSNATPDFNSQHFEVAGFIREVFGYMERFKGQLFVLKIEDDLMSHPLFPVLMRDIALLHKSGIRIIIVPGTRNSIDAQLKAWGLESRFHAGVRLTSEEALPHIEQASLGVAQPDAYKDKARKAAIDNAIHQAQELANGFHRKLGPVYSVRYHVSNYQPSPMVRMMKADAAPVSAQETYEQAAIQFDDQVDVVFQLEPVDQQPAKTPAAQ